MNVLLAAALLALQPQEPIRNGRVTRTEINPKTGHEEVVAVVEWDEAIPLDRERNSLDIRGVRARYFTEPTPRNPKSEVVALEAGRARLDGPAGRLELAEGARIRHENGTTLEAPEGLVLFNKRHVCIPCGTEAPAPGKCTRCGSALKPKTYTTVEIQPNFTLARPGMRLAGRELRADDRLGSLIVGCDGAIDMAGGLRAAAGKTEPSAAPPSDAFTELRCDGPMNVDEISPDRAAFALKARDNVRVRRLDGTGAVTTVIADEVEIMSRRRIDHRTGRPSQGQEPERMTARGHLSLADDRGLQASAQSMEWESRSDPRAAGAPGGPAGALLEALGGTSYDTAVLAGDPVEINHGGSRVRARTARIDRQAARSVFSGDVSAELANADGRGSTPLRLACRALEMTSARSESGLRPREIEAAGAVRLEGLMQNEGQPPARAEADRFSWNLQEERGFLEGRPFVRVTQGRSSILAPRIVMEGRSTIVLQGPKRLRLVQPGGDRHVAYSVSSEGDMVMNSSEGRAILSDRCSVRSEDFQLMADSMEIEFSPDGGGPAALRAYGNVRARRAAGAVNIYGDLLRLAPRQKAISVVGFPAAVAESGGRTIRTREIRFNERDRSTELRGGDAGILLIIDEGRK